MVLEVFAEMNGTLFDNLKARLEEVVFCNLITLAETGLCTSLNSHRIKDRKLY